jgi:hypothetical protein
MNNFIKQAIEEAFASKAQQRFFYAKANEKGTPKKEKGKWSKWAREYSSKTDFSKIPDKKEEEKDENQMSLQFDEVVDEKGNIAMNKKPTNFNKVGITQNKTTDEVVKTAHGQMGAIGKVSGRGAMNTMKYWAESDMSKVLGADKLLHSDDVDYEEAKDEYEDLGIDDPIEQDKRAKQLGFDPNLPDGQQRIVEDPKKYMEEYIESVLSKKKMDNEIVPKETEVKEISPIIKKQIKSLKNSMDSHNLSINDIVNHLKDNE